MTIGRYVKYPLTQTLTAILSINDVLDDDFDFSLLRLSGLIETADTNYKLDGINDLEQVLKSGTAKINLIYISLSYVAKNNQSLNVTISHSVADPYIQIECGGLTSKELEKIFESLKDNVFKVEYYRHRTIKDVAIIQKEAITAAVKILEMSDDLQVRSLGIIENEKDFQNFLYPVLKSHFMDLEDEHYLPKYGTKSYKPDFGIPSAKLLIETKFIKNARDLKRCQAEIHDDAIGYINSSDKYNKVIVAIYNGGGVAVNKSEIKQLEKIRGIESVIICSHVIPNNFVA